jgi:hypothetical protein
LWMFKNKLHNNTITIIIIIIIICHGLGLNLFWLQNVFSPSLPWTSNCFFLLIVWVWNLVSYTKGRTQIDGVWGEYMDIRGRK